MNMSKRQCCQNLNMANLDYIGNSNRALGRLLASYSRYWHAAGNLILFVYADAKQFTRA